MWFGTADGLNRYDGYNFRVFKSDKTNPATLTDSFITTLMEDRSGTLWVGTYGAGLNRMNPDRRSFTRIDLNIKEEYLGMGQNLITSIVEDSKGAVWVSTNTMGVVVLEGENMTWITPENSPNLPSRSVLDMVADDRGRMWLATDKGLVKYIPESRTFELFRHEPDNPNSLAADNCSVLMADKSGFLWIGNGTAGLNRLDPETGLTKRFSHDPGSPNSLGEGTIQCIFEDGAGNLWVGTSNSLSRMEGNDRFVRYVHDPYRPDTLGHPSVVSLAEDMGGVLWVGTYGRGLSKFNHNLQSFRYYTPSQGLTGKDVFAFHETRDGTIWIGTYDGGINVFDPETDRFESLQNDSNDPESLSHDHVYAIYTDRKGEIWAATYEGLNRYVRETNKFRRYYHNPTDPQSLGADRIVQMLEDRQGRFWIATYDSGVDLMDRETGRFRHFVYDPEDESTIANNSTNYLFEDMENRLWVATELGLALMDREQETFTRYRHDIAKPNSLSHDSVMCMYQQKPDEIWVGTYGGGLNRMTPSTGTFIHYQVKDGLPNDAIYGILEDGSRNLWLSTNAGICKFDPQAETYTNFDTSNVLHYQEFNRGGFMERSTGELYFGGQGFYRFMPDEIMGNQYIPPVIITSFKKNGQDVLTDKSPTETNKLMLDYKDSTVSIGFAAMDFTSPRKNSFRYKLEGSSNEWIELGHSNSLTYSQLSPGDYALHIQGSNSDGVWNPQPRILRIHVSSPPWATGKAFIIYGLMLLVAAYLIYRSRERRKQKELQRAITVGKAQFASTVLHNIGNVLNSLRVSCDQGRVKLKESKMRQLLKAHSLMKNHMDDLGNFLIEHPKGKLLPGYFISAGEILNEEHQMLTTELEEMNRKIILMRDIIETQQAHAKQELIAETQDLNLVIDEALKVLQDTLERRHVTICSDYEELPPIKAHKSQLMHIIINLVKNAMEAMDENDRNKRKLIVKTGRIDTDRAYVKVTDNGMGIPAENLPRLFTYGFTTKKSGHGFGLHSCAKAMREMGGSIRAESKGADQGATFTLVLNFGNPVE